jgi:diacylglycerol kinase family enzyme
MQLQTPTEYIAIVNKGSGSSSKDFLIQDIEEVFSTSSNKKCIIKTVGDNEKFDDVLRSSISEAKEHKKGIIAIGGDGTISTIAQLCFEEKVPLGVVPSGTFNLFTKNLKIPQNQKEALQVIEKGNLQPVTVGVVNNKIFIICVGLGLYNKLIELREQDKSKFGRNRVVALISAIRGMFLYKKSTFVNITSPTFTESINTSMALVSVNEYQLQSYASDISHEASQGKLVTIVLKSATKYEIVKTIASALCKKVNLSDKIQQFSSEQLTVNLKRRKIDMVIDGEIASFITPLNFSIDSSNLHVFVP